MKHCTNINIYGNTMFKNYLVVTFKIFIIFCLNYLPLKRHDLYKSSFLIERPEPA